MSPIIVTLIGRECFRDSVCLSSGKTSLVSLEKQIINDFYAPQTRVLARWTVKRQKRNVYPKFIAAQFGFFVVFVKSLFSLTVSSVISGKLD